MLIPFFGWEEKASIKDFKYCEFSPCVFIKILLGCFPQRTCKVFFIWWYFSIYSLYTLLEDKLNVFNCRASDILFFCWKKFILWSLKDVALCM